MRTFKLNWLFPAIATLIGLLVVLTGVAQMTIWKPPATVTASLNTDQLSQGKDSPLLVVDSKSLGDRHGQLSVNASGSGKVLIAQGRSDDVQAWVGKTAHLTVTGVSENFSELQWRYEGGDGPKANPAGSDLWVAETAGNQSANLNWDIPTDGDWSLLISSDGSAPMPQKFSITAQNSQATPWAVPLIILGAVIFIAGILWLIVSLRSGNAKPGKRSTRGSSAFTLLLIAGLAAAALPLSSTSPARADDAASPSNSPSPSNSSSPSVSSTSPGTESSSAAPETTAPKAAGVPVVDSGQLTRILGSVAQTTTEADAAKDSKLLAPRVGGLALEERTSNYKIRAASPTSEAREPVAATDLRLKLVSSDRSWPRSFVAVTQSKQNSVPQVLQLVQSKPRENYKLIGTARMLPGQTLTGSDQAGTTKIDPQSSEKTALSPTAVLTNLTKVLTDPNSEAKSGFDNSQFLQDTKALQDKLIADSKDATFEFKHEVIPETVAVFPAADGGLTVLASLNFTVKASPKSEGATLNLKDPGTIALAGGDSTEKGYSLRFGEQVLLHIPAGKAPAQTTMVAAERGLISAAFTS